jgi:hypothetical protein
MSKRRKYVPSPRVQEIMARLRAKASDVSKPAIRKPPLWRLAWSNPNPPLKVEQRSNQY